ncbi:unnamed protein product, partial [Laminaria digitata]
LKVEAEGKLFSVPDKVEIFCPPSSTAIDLWWKVSLMLQTSDRSGPLDVGGVGVGSGGDGDGDGDGVGDDDGATTGGELAAEKDVRSAGEHSCQICFEHDHSSAMLPCGHGGLCWECGLQIYALTQECPMCRVKIEVV